MTGPTDRTPTRRLSDHGAKGRFVAWWREWGQLVTGVWLLIVSFAVLLVGVEFYKSQAATSRAAKEACVRSRQFGPRLIDFYESAQYRVPSGAVRHVLTHREAGQYRQSIPTSCPGDGRK
jgi:hypothetical protein